MTTRCPHPVSPQLGASRQVRKGGQRSWGDKASYTVAGPCNGVMGQELPSLRTSLAAAVPLRTRGALGPGRRRGPHLSVAPLTCDPPAILERGHQALSEDSGSRDTVGGRAHRLDSIMMRRRVKTDDRCHCPISCCPLVVIAFQTPKRVPQKGTDVVAHRNRGCWMSPMPLVMSPEGKGQEGRGRVQGTPGRATPAWKGPVPGSGESVCLVLTIVR